ncbi:DUF1836 domain-containing protein [Apilactobacillus sp. TMW 2.2459]|uniref:DUF1836 domain-containing protein n=1 Tax=Apilactobacillus xinyiensis TaxID=2841032 RepID=UPI00200E66C8|nr:DUF1836 domain-containing protein [Apilactobacillus xinyiensis]MCL0312569.1 DUF1836 domain-containing protein [Apilactobacillus xinyiensis]
MNKMYKSWQSQMVNITLPKWDDLPKFDLYMDQLIAVVNEAVVPLGADPVTKTMVNNYVKNKATFAPVKKKYQTVHIADIIIISLLKPIFSISLIRSGIDAVTKHNFPKQAYDEFITLLVSKLHSLAQNEPTNHFDNDTDELLSVIADTIVDRLKANNIYKSISKH